MAATQTVAQALQFCKPDNSIHHQGRVRHSVIPEILRPRRGVVVLYGYGTNVRVERGHLVVDDGIGSDRYRGRFPRVGHGLERLVIVGADGSISLSALRWLSDQNVSFVMLERDGNVLATTSPVRPSDVRLRRAQALAHQSDLAFQLSREIIDRKLAGQESVARESLREEATATLIRQIRSELAEVESIDAIRLVESRAAKAYWNAWRSIQIIFPDKELPSVPEHWRSFGSRVSALSGSPRLAANPVNAILNYLYALLEAECRLAIAALGLDPEMGVLHMDTINRDSLACDLMEPIRPEVDAYVLNRIVRQPLKRSWFFEERNGNCRLMSDMTSQLAETAPTWARLVAPLAEWAVKQIASTAKTSRKPIPATRLTQSHKREAKGSLRHQSAKPTVKLQLVCRDCGNPISNGHEKCVDCDAQQSSERLTIIASKGRTASHSDNAEAKRSRTQLANREALLRWSANDQPSWLTPQFYAEKIQPKITSLASRAMMRHLGVSHGYATEIRRGRVPHPRHWLALATLIGLSR